MILHLFHIIWQCIVWFYVTITCLEFFCFLCILSMGSAIRESLADHLALSGEQLEKLLRKPTGTLPLLNVRIVACMFLVGSLFL